MAKECALCDLEAKVTEDPRRGIFGFDCPRCGKYRMTEESLEDEDVDKELQWLRCATRQAAEFGRVLVVTTENYKQLATDHKFSSMSANREKLLQFFMRRSRPGTHVHVRLDLDYPGIDATDARELEWYLEFLADQKYLRFWGGARYSLTYEAWEHLTGPMSAVGTRGRAFVAMSFDSEHDPIYREGIKPSLVESGYEAICLKDVLTNDDINDHILLELRKAEIVIADFTAQKAGVYFEAGFAMALKKEVYWM